MRKNDAPKIGMVDPLQAATRMHVLIIHDLGKIANRRARHRGGQHPPRYFVLGKRFRPAFDQLVDGVDIGNPRRARKEARILAKIGPPHGIEQGTKMMVPRAVEHHIAIERRVGVVG